MNESNPFLTPVRADVPKATPMSTDKPRVPLLEFGHKETRAHETPSKGGRSSQHEDNENVHIGENTFNDDNFELEFNDSGSSNRHRGDYEGLTQPTASFDEITVKR